MRIKTADLIGPALDWAVAQAYKLITVYNNPVMVQRDARNILHWQPSIDWAQGGPIIERGGIAVERKIIEGTTEHEWKAYVPYIHAYGPTPLIAAMRCYVASKLGDEVEVPDALLS